MRQFTYSPHIKTIFTSIYFLKILLKINIYGTRQLSEKQLFIHIKMLVKELKNSYFV